jgi:hypothetical protein
MSTPKIWSAVPWRQTMDDALCQRPGPIHVYTKEISMTHIEYSALHQSKYHGKPGRSTLCSCHVPASSSWSANQSAQNKQNGTRLKHTIHTASAQTIHQDTQKRISVVYWKYCDDDSKNSEYSKADLEKIGGCVTAALIGCHWMNIDMYGVTYRREAEEEPSTENEGCLINYL